MVLLDKKELGGFYERVMLSHLVKEVHMQHQIICQVFYLGQSQQFQFVRKMNVREISFENKSAKRKWFTFMISFCDVCVRVYFLKSVLIYCGIKLLLRFLLLEIIVGSNLKAFCERMDLNLFCHSESGLEVENKIQIYDVLRFKFKSKVSGILSFVSKTIS